jgi:glutaredoxin
MATGKDPGNREIVMYTRGGFCPDVTRARRALQRWRLPFREINVRQDPAAEQRCLEWNDCLAMPVIVIAKTDEDLPVEPPPPLKPDQSVRDLDRGYIIAEASTSGLQAFLTRHGFLASDEA